MSTIQTWNFFNRVTMMVGLLLAMCVLIFKHARGRNNKEEEVYTIAPAELSRVWQRPVGIQLSAFVQGRKKPRIGGATRTGGDYLHDAELIVRAGILTTR